MFVSLFKALCFPFFFFFEKQLAFSSVLRILSLIEVSGGGKDVLRLTGSNVSLARRHALGLQ